MAYTQITATWNGFTGSPGWVRMRFAADLAPVDASAAAANWRTFLGSIASFGPSGSSLTFSSGYQIFGSAGELTSEDSLTTVPTAISCTGSSAYAGGAGAVVDWLTGVFLGGRRVRGRTFLVPLTSTAFSTDGTLASATQSSIQTAAVTFAASVPEPVVVAKRGSPGSIVATPCAMTGALVPDRSAILRSRRD